MMNRTHKQKLTLKDSYRVINRQLWQQKQINQDQERENLKLKTQINRASRQKDSD